jgi:hypothetical protein
MFWLLVALLCGSDPVHGQLARPHLLRRPRTNGRGGVHRPFFEIAPTASTPRYAGHYSADVRAARPFLAAPRVRARPLVRGLAAPAGQPTATLYAATGTSNSRYGVASGFTFLSSGSATLNTGMWPLALPSGWPWCACPWKTAWTG